MLVFPYLAEHPNGARDTKQNRIEVLLLHVVVLEEDAAVGVDIRPRILDFSGRQKNIRHHLVQFGDQLQKYK